MLAWLEYIASVLIAFPQLVLWAVVSAINLLVAAIGAFIAAAVSLLPDFPAAPDEPPEGVIGILAWLFPIGGLLSLLVAGVALWGAWLLIRIPLRWAKVV